MTNSKISRLLALSDSEFSKSRAAPLRQRFKGRNVNLNQLGKDWERQRGAAARMMGVVLREDSESLYQKVSADPATAATFAEAVGWLEKEAIYLRKTAGRMELAVSRLGSAIGRYRTSLAAGDHVAGAPASTSA